MLCWGRQASASAGNHPSTATTAARIRFRLIPSFSTPDRAISAILTASRPPRGMVGRDADSCKEMLGERVLVRCVLQKFSDLQEAPQSTLTLPCLQRGKTFVNRKRGLIPRKMFEIKCSVHIHTRTTLPSSKGSCRRRRTSVDNPRAKS